MGAYDGAFFPAADAVQAKGTLTAGQLVELCCTWVQGICGKHAPCVRASGSARQHVALLTGPLLSHVIGTHKRCSRYVNGPSY
jgi:hypothetical protein